MNSSNEVRKESMKAEATAGSAERQHDAAERRPFVGAEIDRRLGEAARQCGEAAAHDDDRRRQRHQHVAEHDGDARRAEAGEIDQDEQRDADDDAGDQDRQAGEARDRRSERARRR